MKYARNTTAPAAFTLVEMLVVILVISIVAAIAIPTAVGLFTAGADNQAYNMLSAQMTAARSYAIRNSTYTLVHVQVADPAAFNGSMEDKTYMMLMRYDRDSTFMPGVGIFSPVPDADPLPVPGKIAFGNLQTPYVAGNAYADLDDAALAGFTTFNIVFSPSGTVVTAVDGKPIIINPTHSLFTGPAGKKLWNPDLVWDDVNKKPLHGQIGTTGVTLFDYTKIAPLSPAERKTYLNDNGQFLAINMYTGQLLPKE